MASWLIGLGSPAATLRRAVRLSEEGKAAEAFPLLARVAKMGNAEAEYRVARCYLEGSGVPASRRRVRAGSSARRVAPISKPRHCWRPSV